MQQSARAHVIHANRLERLAERLIEQWHEQPLADPLASEVVLVPHLGLGRWLKQRVAQSCGVAAMLQCQLPGAFVWQQLETVLGAMPAASAWSREALVWRLWQVLGRAEQGPDPLPAMVKPLDGAGRFELASRLADVFDEYLLYRADWLEAWERDPKDDWQGWLWAQLAAGTEQPHRVALLRRFSDEIGQLPPDVWPKRITLFAVGHLPPVLRDAIAVMGQCGLTIDWYFLNPCQEYWHDLVSEREMARLWRDHPEQAELSDVGHSLLSSWGQMAREQLSCLMDQPWQHDDGAGFQSPESSTSLGALQAAMLKLQANESFQPDPHLQVHSAHTPLREVQIVKECIADQMDRASRAGNPLAPHEIAIVTPNIERYATLIDSVFSDAPSLPVEVADEGRQHQVVSTFLLLLKFLSSRWGATDLLALVESEPIRLRLALTDDELDWFSQALGLLGFRWGATAQAVAERGGVVRTSASLEQGLHRLLASLVLPVTTVWDGDSANLDIDPGAEVPGRLMRWLRQLLSFHQLSASSHSASSWRSLLQALVANTLAVDYGDERGAEALDQLQSAVAWLGFLGDGLAIDETLDWAAVASALRWRLNTRPTLPPSLAGGIACGSLASLRGLPFRVICALGFDERSFPRRDRDQQLNRIRSQRRSGDRSRRLDDRQAMLDLFISARQALIISYVGRDLQTDDPKNPSALVRELIDCTSEQLVQSHPLQPFSPKYFADGVSLYSYSPAWVRAAQSGNATSPFPQPALLTDALPERIDVDELIEFAVHPARWFIKMRLGLTIRQRSRQLSDQSFWQLDGLRRFQLRGAVLELMLEDRLDHGLRFLRHSGLLPAGQLGEQALQSVTEDCAPLLSSIRSATGGSIDDVPCRVSVEIAGIKVDGWVRGHRNHQLIQWRAANVKAADALGLWVRHRLLALSGLDMPAAHFGLVNPKGVDTVRLAQATVFDAPLDALVEVYKKAWRQPVVTHHDEATQKADRYSGEDRNDYLTLLAEHWPANEALIAEYEEATAWAAGLSRSP